MQPGVQLLDLTRENCPCRHLTPGRALPMISPMGQGAFHSVLMRAGLFADAWWPLLILGALLAFCFIKPLGSWAVRFIQTGNEFVHTRLFLPGAAILLHDRQIDSGWFSFLRLIWFGTVFAFLITGSFLAPTGIAFAISMLGSWLALSVGGYWVGMESMALEDEESDPRMFHHVGLAHQIQPTGAIALLLVLFFIPVSFMTADAAFDWFESPDSSLRTWIFYALHLFYQAAVDVGEVIQLEVSNVRPVANGGKALVLGHFIGLTFLVLNGLTLVARREHAIRSWIRRLETTGSIEGVERFGARIWDDLLVVAQCEDLSRHPEAALHALAKCRPPAPRRLGRSPILHDTISLLKAKPSSTEDLTIPVRQGAAQALGTWRHQRGAEALMNALLDKAERREVRAEAATALQGYGDVPGVDPVGLRKALLEVLSDGANHAQIRVRAIDAMILIHEVAPDTEPVKHILKQLTLRGKEPDAVNARALHALRVLNLLDDETQELGRLFKMLESGGIAERKQAAAMLVEFGGHNEATLRLIQATSKEQEALTRAQMVKALSKIAVAGHHHHVLRPAILAESRYGRFEVRLESLAGLDAFGFDGEVADRLLQLAASRESRKVAEKATKLIAKKDLRRVPKELAARCRALLSQPEVEEDFHDDVPLTAQEDAVVDSVVAVLKEHPEIVEKLGGPEGIGEIIADEIAATQATSEKVRIEGLPARRPSPEPASLVGAARTEEVSNLTPN
jgi:hypothetical protein